jgi:hypothetical protein
VLGVMMDRPSSTSMARSAVSGNGSGAVSVASSLGAPSVAPLTGN